MLLGLAAMGVSVWLDAERTEGRARDSGRAIAVLANAARHHVQADYEGLIASATPETLDARGDFTDEDILPENFVFSDGMKRDLKVLVLPSSNGVRVLSGQFPDSGDGRPAHAGITQGMGGQHMGIVESARCPSGVTAPCLMGPGVAESLSDFDSAPAFAASRPTAGALMVLYEFSHDDWCGDFLHRTETAICADANRMEQTVTVAGAITNVSVIEGFGTVTLHGPLAVGRELSVTGTVSSATARMTAGSGLEAGTATVSGSYGAGALNRACLTPATHSAVCSDNRVIVDQTVLGGTINVDGRTTAPLRDADADIGDLNAGCIQVDGTASVEGRVRVVRQNMAAKGSC